MCDKCKSEHKHYTCECGKEFVSPSSLGGHQLGCSIHKEHKQIELKEREAKRLPNGLFKCENPDCNNEHDGSYGSGKFCCKKCRMHVIGKRSYATRVKVGTFVSPFSKEGGSVGIQPKGDWKCSTCGKTFNTRKLMQEHYREEHYNGKCNHSWNKGLTSETDDRIQKQSKQISQTLKEGFSCGRIKPTEWTSEMRMKQSNNAKRRELGGWHSSKKFVYNGVTLASSYELTVAQDLDKNGIRWEKPSYFIWKLNGVEHRYYPDLYLPDYDVYLDPKNKYLIENVNPRFGITDVEKINLVMEQVGIKVLILNKDELSWDSIKSKL